jgi:hypothetical protein
MPSPEQYGCKALTIANHFKHSLRETKGIQRYLLFCTNVTCLGTKERARDKTETIIV